VKLSRRTFAVLFLLGSLERSIVAQSSASTASLLLRFDNEHDLAKKEHLLLTVTNQDANAGPALLRLAQATTNTDTRWMAMRGMATLHYTAGASFLEASLKDSDALVRANAARALGDLRIRGASAPLLAMFAVEQEPAAIQQASLALRMLNVQAAAPILRQKIPLFSGQTRAWLIQALGRLGSTPDVPLIAGYLEEMGSDMAATEAIQELAGVSFGRRTRGLFSYPPPETLAARAWWKSHQDDWPRCADCHPK
jgi:HEAT repeat protein